MKRYPKIIHIESQEIYSKMWIFRWMIPNKFCCLVLILHQISPWQKEQWKITFH